MTTIPEQIFYRRDLYLPFLKRLEALFGEMDRTYENVADQYGFRCNGCVDNCCFTRFYHHTLLEYLYLKEGVDTFEPELYLIVRDRSLVVCEKMTAADRKDQSLRIMCPLNRDDRCTAYRYRPMICRLHGIPHELHRPGGQVIQNPGCDAFFDQSRSHGRTQYISFDRTPFYHRMAILEKEFRQKIGSVEKIKLTIAQMLVTLTGGNDEIN